MITPASSSLLDRTSAVSVGAVSVLSVSRPFNILNTSAVGIYMLTRTYDATDNEDDRESDDSDPGDSTSAKAENYASFSPC